MNVIYLYCRNFIQEYTHQHGSADILKKSYSTFRKINMIKLIMIIFLSQCEALDFFSCNDTNPKMTGDFICKVNNNYDNTKVPGTLPLILDSKISIDDITEVDETHKSITIQVWIALKWADPGLITKLM